jgi:hypothetical protein
MTITRIFLAIGLLFSAPLSHASFHTNTITTPGGSFAFSVDGSAANNPTIQLIAGVTNILIINTAAFHPVVITTAPATAPQFSGATPQNVFNQNITLTTPTSGFPTTLYYVCGFHGFSGQINLAAPAGPPPNTILKVIVGTNVVMVSTGTNTTYTFIPEFSSNLTSGAWSPVPGFTNTFLNGTNTTRFNRLDPICGPNVFLRIRQQPN